MNALFRTNERAETIMAALNGIKSSARTVPEYCAAQDRLARLFGRALSL